MIYPINGPIFYSHLPKGSCVLQLKVKPSDRGHIYGIYCTIKKHWIKSITDLSYLTAHDDIDMQTISYYPCPQLSNVG